MQQSAEEMDQQHSLGSVQANSPAPSQQYFREPVSPVKQKMENMMMKRELEMNQVEHSIFRNNIPQMQKGNSERNETYDRAKLSTLRKLNTCNVCGKVLSSPSSYYVHMKKHSGNKPYNCPICDVRFCRKPYLEVHMRTHTGERPFECNHCLKRFTQKSSLNIHKRVHTGERPYACDICDKKFAVKSYVDAHKWTHITGSQLRCEECHIPFNSRAQFIIHMRSHSTALCHECPCGRTFAKDSYLIRHQIKEHTTPNASAEANLLNTVGFHHLYALNMPKKTRNRRDMGSYTMMPTNGDLLTSALLDQHHHQMANSSMDHNSSGESIQSAATTPSPTQIHASSPSHLPSPTHHITPSSNHLQGQTQNIIVNGSHLLPLAPMMYESGNHV